MAVQHDSTSRWSGMFGVLSFQQAFPEQSFHLSAYGGGRRYEICAAVLFGHRVTSSRSSSSVQRDMTASVMAAPAPGAMPADSCGAILATALSPHRRRLRSTREPARTGQLINASYRVPRFCTVGAGADTAGGEICWRVLSAPTSSDSRFISAIRRGCFLKGFQLVDHLVLRRLQVTDCKGSRHGREDAGQRSYGNSHEQPSGSRRETSVRLLSHESLLRLKGRALTPPVLSASCETGGE